CSRCARRGYLSLSPRSFRPAAAIQPGVTNESGDSRCRHSPIGSPSCSSLIHRFNTAHKQSHPFASSEASYEDLCLADASAFGLLHLPVSVCYRKFCQTSPTRGRTAGGGSG